MNPQVLFARTDIALVKMPANDMFVVCAVGRMPDRDRAVKERLALMTAESFLANRVGKVALNEDTFHALVHLVRDAWRQHAT